MVRAAIYARFSTDLQNERSIEDQLFLCRDYAARGELEVVETFDDRARSGGSIFGRDGLLRLMDRARDRAFDVVVVEALDRLSRDMEDLAGIHKRLTFLGIEIRAVNEGVVNTVLIGLRGLVGQLYRDDNAQKIRRGQAGRVRNGLVGSGLTYGYATVPSEMGRRVVVEAEVETVCRIFEEYVSGRTPRAIAHGLNKDRIPPPRGRVWNASTINGNAQRGSGILNNELYIGRIVWNRVRMLKDPDTGKRVSRPNPRNEWQIREVPELAIVSRELFEAARARKQSCSRIAPHRQRKPKYLLSGLLRCSACGAGMSTKGKDGSGRIRIRCSAHAESGTCPEPRTYYLDSVEEAVVAALKTEMRHPQVLAEYVKAYQAERIRLASDAEARRSRLTRRIEALDREIDRLVDAIAKGLGDPAILGPRSTELGRERQDLRAELAAAPVPPDVILLHPTALARYEEQFSRLQEALARGIRSGDSDAAEAIRDLVETVAVHPDPARPGGLAIEISGRLTALLGDPPVSGAVRRVGGSMVAGEGFEPPTKGL